MDALKQLIGSRGLALAFGDAAGRAAALFASVLLARGLGDIGFGYLAWAFAVAGYVSIAVDGGLATLAAREVARVPRAAWWYTRMFLVGRTLLACVAIGGALLVGWALLRDPERRAVLVPALLWLVPLALGGEWIFQALHRPELIGATRMVGGLAWLASAVIWSLSSRDLAAAAWTRPAAEAAALALTLPFALRLAHRHLGERGLSLPRYLREGAPIALTVLFTSIYAASLDIIIMGFSRPAAEVGWYAAAYRLYLVLPLIPKLLLILYFPRFARAVDAATRNARYGEFRDLALRLGLPLAGVSAVVAPELVAVLYGPAFAPAAPLLRLLTPAAAVICVASVYPQILLAAGRSKDALACYAIAVALNIAINVLGIPRFGAPAAAVATLMAEFAVWPVGLLLARRRLGLQPIPRSALARSLAPGAAAIVAAAIGRAILLGTGAPGGALTVLLLPCALAALSWAVVQRYTSP